MTRPLLDDSAERAVLGAILVRNAAMDDVSDNLDPEHFGKPHHEHIYAAMRELHQGGQSIDPVTLCPVLERRKVLDDAMRAYVYGLDMGVPKSSNIEAYAKLVKEKATLRKLRDAARRIIADIENEDAASRELLESAEQSIYAIGATAIKTDWISGRELAVELEPLIDKMLIDRQPVTGVATGFPELDRITRGFQPSDLILLGARPSQGKTAFGISVALTASQETPTAVFSIEMSRHAIGFREVIHEANVDGYRMLSGRLSEVDIRRVGEGLMHLGELNIWHDESAHLSPLQVRTKLRRLQSRVGRIGLVVIDYLQLMAAMPDDRRENKTNQVAGISRALKLLAREFRAPFLVLSQLNRGPKDGTRPTMADLRDSGALEQDADVVLLLHRPEVYDPTPQNAGLAEIIIGKQRNGPTGTVELVWRPEPMRFENRQRTA
jgi:replicative DNA helicase